MKTEIREMFAEIANELGSTEVAVADVKEKFPKAVGHVMRNAPRVRRGVYDVSGAKKAAPVPKKKPAPVAPAPVADATVEQANVVIGKFSSVTEESLVPDIDEEYVPFGCYQTVRKVIKSPLFAPVYITGDSGNGKTMGVEQACAKEKREAVIINITNETSEEDLIGGYFLDSGSMTWRDGPVITAMRRGAVLVLDEIDQARPSIMALQTVLQGNPYYIKKTNEIVKPAQGFTVIATANTKGDGIGLNRFAGAQVLNEAFLERFNIVIEQEYPTTGIEKRILRRHTDNENLIDKLTRFAKITRSAMEAGSIESCIATRRLVQICTNINILGDEVEGIRMALNRFDAETRDAFIELYTKLEVELERKNELNHAMA